MSTPHGEPIYILDQVTTRPGQGQAFLDAYMTRYAPGAEARGMTLVHSWVTPPLWLDDQPNTLFIVWSVKGAPAWWQMSFQSRRDPEVTAWWEEAQTMMISRHRSFLGDVADIASLTDV
jgi:hypothetical protein